MVVAPRLRSAMIDPASHLPALRKWFARRTHPCDVEDMVQETVLRFYGRADAGAVEHEGYLFRIAASVLADAGRRRTVRQADRHILLADHHHPVEDRDPARVLEGKEQVERMIVALQTMTDRARDAFVQHRFEERSYAEIADAMGISVSAVEKHMMKALRHLTAMGLP